MEEETGFHAWFSDAYDELKRCFPKCKTSNASAYNLVDGITGNPTRVTISSGFFKDAFAFILFDERKIIVYDKVFYDRLNAYGKKMHFGTIVKDWSGAP